MKQLLPLAWSGLKSQKRSTALLLSAIILSIVFFIVIGLIGSSSLHTIDMQNKDLYGGQKMVAWNLTDEQKRYFQKSPIWEEIGKITVYGMVSAISDTALGIGTMDEEAVRLGHIRLAKGRWPQSSEEIVLEKNAYRYLGGQPYAVGDKITLNIMAAGQETTQQLSFQVVGLIENYSAVWREAYATQTWERTAVPATVSFLVAESFSGFFEEATETWLLNSRSNSYRVLHDSLPEGTDFSFNYSVYPQIGYYGGMGEAAMNIGKLCALIGGMVFLCMIAILLNGFLMSVDRRKRQFALLRCIGATKKQACTYLFCEAFLLLGMGIPIGLFLGILGSFGAVKVFSVWNGTAIIYHFNLWVPFAAVLICVLCVCLATLLPAIHASKTAPIAGTRTIYEQKKICFFEKIFPKKNLDKKCILQKTESFLKKEKMLTPFGLMLISMRKSIGKAALTTITFALVVLVFHVMMMTDIVDYQIGSPYEKADAIFSAMEIHSKKKEGLLWESSERADALPASVFSDVRRSLDVAFQNAAVIPRFYCSIPFSRCDPYFNGHFRFDYKMLGLRNWEKWGQYNYSFEKQVQYGYTEQEYLIEPRIFILDDFLLGQLHPYVVDGAVNAEAIQRGEEIVLCMPDYYLLVQEEENGLQVKEWIPDGKIEIPREACLMENSGWLAGDMLTFTWPGQEEGGYVRHERTVRIGAIIKGTPQIESSLNGVFVMAAGQNTLENLNVPYEISRVYVYFEEDADIPAAEACLEQMASRAYPLARLSMQTEEALAEQQQRHMNIAISGMLSISLLALGLLGLMNTVSGRIHSRMHEIGLLRCIGMAKGQVYRMLLYEGAAFGHLSFLFGMVLSLFLLPKYQENWLHTRMPFYFLVSYLACNALSILTIFLPAREILKKSPTKML